MVGVAARIALSQKPFLQCFSRTAQTTGAHTRMTESETSKTPARLDLNPGRTRKRNARSGCRCLLLLIFLVAFVVVAYFVGSLSYKFGRVVYRHLLTPHNNLYLKGNETFPAQLVVRPLIDANQTFDVAVTVWARVDTEAEKQFRMNVTADSDVNHNLDKELAALEGEEPFNINALTLELYDDDYVLETPVYSDIAFRGLRLTDKDVFTTIKFRIPTARFRNVNLTQHDLRASFVLIPSSPSLADHITNYSSWFPFYIKPRPRRAWPFPLGSTDNGNRTLVDQALDSFGLSIPLIEFHTIPSRCPNIEFSTTDNGSEAESPRTPEGAKETNSIRHPYVVTRTQLRIITETHALNRTAYDQRKDHLQNNVCRDSQHRGRRSRRCLRLYQFNGNLETALELSLPVPGKDNETEIQAAYPPYLSTLTSGFGPLDLIAVPVDRENCSNVGTGAFSASTNFLPNSTDAEFMDITWRVSVSGRSPAKILLGSLISPNSRPNHTASEYHNMEGHLLVELMNGIRGQRFYDDAHPRRRVLLMVVSMVCVTVGSLFDLHYWYTRINTAGISVFATILRALSLTLAGVLDASEALSESVKFSFLERFLEALCFIAPLCMIRAIAGREIRWKNMTWIPIMRRIPLLHKERASMRLDAQTIWPVRHSILLFFFGLYHFSTPKSTSIIPARLPFSDIYEKKGYLAPQRLISSLAAATGITGVILQLLLNQRSRQFAGCYNVAMIPAVVDVIAKVSLCVPSVVGRVELSRGISVHVTVVSALTMIMAWQAMMLPSAPQNEVDEDEE